MAPSSQGLEPPRKSARFTFGDGKTMVLLDQSQREIDAGRDAS
jgi:hypothetical protein